MAQEKEGSLVAVIADEDTITGFLLAGVGDVDLRKRSNFLAVDKNTNVRAIEQAFKDFTLRDDIAIILISQPIASMIRTAVANHNKVRRPHAPAGERAPRAHGARCPAQGEVRHGATPAPGLRTQQLASGHLLMMCEGGPPRRFHPAPPFHGGSGSVGGACGARSRLCPRALALATPTSRAARVP